MRQSHGRLIALALAGLLIGGFWAALPVTGEVGGGEGDETATGATTTMQDNESPVEADIDCNRSRVELTAPEGYRYDVTVTVANITATENEVTRSTVGSVEGNETVELPDRGIVFVFAQNRSEDGRIVATDVKDCSTGTGEETTTVQTDDAESAIRVDCEENDVKFVGFDETEYVVKLVTVSVSPDGSSTSSETRSLEGNTTISVDEGSLVAAFASTDEIGDDRTISTIQNCSSYGPKRVSSNETDVENGDYDHGM